MSCEGCEEGAYVIDKLAKLLAEIAVIVNGVEPHDTLWSYHDLPEKVRALKQAKQPAAAVPEPAFRLTWRDGQYRVSKPNIGDTDCYTAEQVRAIIAAPPAALAVRS